MLYFYVTPGLIGYVFFLSESGEMCAMKEVTLCSDDPKSRESAQQLGQVSYTSSSVQNNGSCSLVLLFLNFLTFLLLFQWLTLAGNFSS